ncbi:MAG: pyrroloquinoline quinone-dependent dehydrogenase [Halosimplex sp.]
MSRDASGSDVSGSGDLKVEKPGSSTIEQFEIDVIPREPVTEEQLTNGPDDPQSWLMYGDGYRRHHHTVADAIAPDTVEALEREYVVDLGVENAGSQGSPLLVPGDPPVLYVTHGPDVTRAFDARNGDPLWTHDYEPEAKVVKKSPPASRGLAVLGDTVYKATLDYGLLAIDRYTGGEQWYYNGAYEYLDETADGDPQTAMLDALTYERKLGETSSYPPLVYDDTVLKGSFGGEWGVSGWLEGITTDGDQSWNFRTVPPEYWIDDEWKHGGGTTWGAPAVDPERGIAISPTSNPGPWNGVVRPGYNWYTAGKVAVDMEDGGYQWHYQEVPHDWWDYDSPSPAFIYDAEVDGEERTLASWAGKTGWVFTVDAETGKLITRSDPYVEHLNTFTLPGTSFEDAQWIMPHYTGGTDPQPSAFDRERRIMIVKGRNQPAKWKRSPPIDYEVNERYLGLKTKTAKPPQRDEIDGWEKPPGTIAALDPVTGDILWQNWRKKPSWGGALTTTTGVTFAGVTDGLLVAYDTETGEKLWSDELGPAVDGNPISWYDPETERQYVAVTAGGTHPFAPKGLTNRLAVYSAEG